MKKNFIVEGTMTGRVSIDKPNFSEVDRTFASAVDNQEARTENDMKARKSTAKACTDLFFKIGASRGKNIIPEFVAAFVENSDYAMRIAQWSRDVRGGAGERQLFKHILAYLEVSDPKAAKALIVKIPEIGRWDDMLIEYKNKDVETFAFLFYRAGIVAKNGLAAKWAPRKGFMAKKLREAWGMSPKEYRKTIVGLTDCVESMMCAKEWDNIPFGMIPSLAAARYKTAFYRNAEEAYTSYIDALVKGEAKVNAGAVYPYDVLKTIQGNYDYKTSHSNYGAGLHSNGYIVTNNATELAHIKAQWDALQNFIGDADVLPVVDVSGSMNDPAGGNANLTCMDVAVSLGLYCAEKNTGKFKDVFVTFSNEPEILALRGDIIQKYQQMRSSTWGMNTDLVKTFDGILKVAIRANVAAKEMPSTVVIFSDMQFDHCAAFDDSAMDMIERKYEKAGYATPKIVFWNLRAYDNAPVKFDKQNVALVSGFSPAILKSILSDKLEDFTPENVMLETIMSERYDYEY